MSLSLFFSHLAATILLLPVIYLVMNMRVIVVRSTLIITDITYEHKGATGFKRSGEGIQLIRKEKKRILMGPIPAKWKRKKKRYDVQ